MVRYDSVCLPPQPFDGCLALHLRQGGDRSGKLVADLKEKRRNLPDFAGRADYHAPKREVDLQSYCHDHLPPHWP